MLTPSNFRFLRPALMLLAGFLLLRYGLPLMLPFLAAGLGATQDSVTVAYQQTGVTEFYSYFDLIPVAQMQLLLPLAGVLCLVTGILAVVGITAKKPGCLKAIRSSKARWTKNTACIPPRWRVRTTNITSMRCI